MSLLNYLLGWPTGGKGRYKFAVDFWNMVKLANVSEACTGNRTLSAFNNGGCWWYTSLIFYLGWNDIFSNCPKYTSKFTYPNRSDFPGASHVEKLPFWKSISFKGFISAVTHGRGLCPPTLRGLQELNHLQPPCKTHNSSPPSNGWDWKTFSVSSWVFGVFLRARLLVLRSL